MLALLIIYGCAGTEKSEPVDVMYFILIDRFVDGDSSNNAGNNPASYLPYDGSNPEALKYYQGGDLAGITQSLGKLKKHGYDHDLAVTLPGQLEYGLCGLVALPWIPSHRLL